MLNLGFCHGWFARVLSLVSEGQFPGVDQLVDVVVGGQHGRPGRRVQRDRTPRVGAVAPHAVLAVLSRFHVPEEPQDLRIVRRRLPQLVQLPGTQ